MSEPYTAQIVECPMCGEYVDVSLIMEWSGLCCNCDPENQADCKADEINDREGDV